MISQEILKKLAIRYHTTEFPNISREYCQHLFLSEFYKLEGSEKLLFKGGTALHILYGSPRFSEDLDFSLLGVQAHLQKNFIESLFNSSLAAIESAGLEVKLGAKPGPTSEGYYAEAIFQLYDYPPLTLSLNISARKSAGLKTELDSVPNDFIPVYNLVHTSQESLVEEKIFGALLMRKKARDFYDLYFIMRKGMLSPSQKRRLAEWSRKILSYSETIDFKKELSVFLPLDQQNIIKNFKTVLAHELQRQIAG